MVQQCAQYNVQLRSVALVALGIYVQYFLRCRLCFLKRCFSHGQMLLEESGRSVGSPVDDSRLCSCRGLVRDFAFMG